MDGTPRMIDLAPHVAGSPLALSQLELDPDSAWSSARTNDDALLYVVEGSGSLSYGADSFALVPGTAALVLAGEESTAEASSALRLLRVTVGPNADRHAPLGRRERVVRLDEAGAETATGARSFQLLFGPHNGSTRATLFAGYIPPGKAPWHYHLYDEIVWVPEGPGRLHLEEATHELAAGAAFRLRPRQVHIVENPSERELTIIGVFTPGGSPSAAYLSPEEAATYAFAD
jgi:quercetin dioxygenase-like cupin family protein